MVRNHNSLLSINNGINISLMRIIFDVCNNDNTQTTFWTIKQRDNWISCTHDSTLVPDQGWKLHISALVSSAQTVLQRVLPVLFTSRIHFKVASSLENLDELNRGKYGTSQIGKFITIYPHDDHEAVRLAEKLDEVTRDLHHQYMPIPSDRPLRPGSLIHYRYGAMRQGQYIQNKTGAIQAAIKNPDGELEPDLRQNHYEPPVWATDPFIDAGIASDLPKPSSILKERYLMIAPINKGHRIIYLGIDLETAQSCIIKKQGPAVHSGDKFRLLHQEAKMLTLLAGHSFVPRLIDVVEQDDDLYLAVEDIAGETLLDRIRRQSAIEDCLSMQQIVIWGQELAEIMAKIHAENLVYADIKPSNIIISKQGKLYLIDFDSAHEQGNQDSNLRSRGTPGFMSPQQSNFAQTTIADDIYGLGALLSFMATGVDPSYISDRTRPWELLKPGINSALSGIINRCLQERPQDRYPSMSALKEALHAVQDQTLSVIFPFGDERLAEDKESAQSHYKALAHQLLKTLCDVAEKPTNNNHLHWISKHDQSHRLAVRDINTGNSGTLLALSALVAEFSTRPERQVLTEGAFWLKKSQPFNASPLSGLYVGESGVGAALLHAGYTLRDSSLIETATECSRNVSTLPFVSNDLFNGTAGRLRFHLFLWDETGEKEHLQAALFCAEQLLSTCQWNNDNECFWAVPDGYGAMSGKIYTGYAHGAAGIADALLDIFEATGDERFLTAVQGTARWLIRLAKPALEDGSGLNWPYYEDGQIATPFWCHGATGIGNFFLHMARLGVINDARDIAVRAARSTARGIRWVGPTLCHGLAGSIEFLLDIYQFTRDRRYLTEAFSLGTLIETFGTEKDGDLVFYTEASSDITPDYMVGYAGIATSFLRLSQPERLPHLLSRDGFRYYKTIAER